MRYFFHAIGGQEVYEDDEGEVLSGDKAARAHAADLVRKLSTEAEWAGFSIVIQDGRGRELGRLPINALPVDTTRAAENESRMLN
jgi:hypothetical protein